VGQVPSPPDGSSGQDSSRAQARPDSLTFKGPYEPETFSGIWQLQRIQLLAARGVANEDLDSSARARFAERSKKIEGHLEMHFEADGPFMLRGIPPKPDSAMARGAWAVSPRGRHVFTWEQGLEHADVLHVLRMTDERLVVHAQRGGFRVQMKFRRLKQSYDEETSGAGERPEPLEGRPGVPKEEGE
jgi:hypothetical protein